jgi:hypothetical protein
MAFLNKKEQILDVILTDRGRELLSKNSLNFKYFSFSDEGVDYSGSLSSSLVVSGSYEKYIYQSFITEPESKKTKLNTMLYTTTIGKSLPEFKSNIPDTSPISLKRYYVLDDQFLKNKQFFFENKPEGIVVKTTTQENNRVSIEENYAISQHIQQTKDMFSRGENITGRRIGIELVVVDDDKILNIRTGEVTEGSLKDSIEKAFKNEVIFDYDQNVEIVSSRDKQEINFFLKNDNGTTPPLNGFLIEVFESGSDGRVLKLKREDTVNVYDEVTVEKGFSNYLDIEVDK